MVSNSSSPSLCFLSKSAAYLLESGSKAISKSLQSSLISINVMGIEQDTNGISLDACNMFILFIARVSLIWAAGAFKSPDNRVKFMMAASARGSKPPSSPIQLSSIQSVSASCSLRARSSATSVARALSFLRKYGFREIRFATKSQMLRRPSSKLLLVKSCSLQHLRRTSWYFEKSDSFSDSLCSMWLVLKKLSPSPILDSYKNRSLHMSSGFVLKYRFSGRLYAHKLPLSPEKCLR